MKEVEKPKEVNQVKIESESESSEDEKEEEEEQAMEVDARKNEEKRLGCSYVADVSSFFSPVFRSGESRIRTDSFAIRTDHSPRWIDRSRRLRVL